MIRSESATDSTAKVLYSPIHCPSYSLLGPVVTITRKERTYSPESNTTVKFSIDQRPKYVQSAQVLFLLEYYLSCNRAKATPSPI